MNRVFLTILIVAIPVISACEDSERLESRMLLEQMQTLDINLPYQRRKSAVKRLEALVFSEARLSSIRDRCVRAHRALIEAEEQQEKAKRVLNDLPTGNAKASVPISDSVEIARAIERSNAEIERAKKSFPSCERDIRRLKLRFATGRGLR